MFLGLVVEVGVLLLAGLAGLAVAVQVHHPILMEPLAMQTQVVVVVGVALKPQLQLLAAQAALALSSSNTLYQ